MRVAPLAAAAAIGIATLSAGAAPAHAADTDTAYGVTTFGKLVKWVRNDPAHPFFVGQIAVPEMEQIVGMDVRPADGQIYLLTKGKSAFFPNPSTGKLYTVDTSTAVLTLVGTLGTPLQGDEFDIDFNPCPTAANVPPNALRIVATPYTTEDGSTTTPGQNLRIAPAALAAGGTLTVVTDTPLAANATIAGAAYTDITATPGASCTTTLYDIDSATNRLKIQGSPSPNDGTITDVGSLMVNVSSLQGFDIADDGTAYLAAQREFGSSGANSTTFFKVDLATGQTTNLGDVGNELLQSMTLAPMAVDPGPVPAVPEVPLAALMPLAAVATVATGFAVKRRRARRIG